MPDVQLPPSVSRVDGKGGLPALSVETSVGRGELYLHGAHVTAWAPSGSDPVLWMSEASEFGPGKPIRGGVPICFPWFGAGRGGDMAPAHGFARLADWTLLGAEDDDGTVRVVLRLADADVAGLPGADAWTHPFELTYIVTFGAELTLSLEVHNPGDTEYSVEEALHTYLSVGDIKAVTVEGLDGAQYLDKAAGAGPGPVAQDGVLRFSGETDRVYSSDGIVTVVDPGRRRLTLTKHRSASTVVWNPWIAKAAAMPDYGDDEWPTMVCLETANVLDAAVTVPPGQAHAMTATYACEALP